MSGFLDRDRSASPSLRSIGGAPTSSSSLPTYTSHPLQASSQARASFDSVQSDEPSWSSLETDPKMQQKGSGSSSAQRELSASYFSRRRAQNRASQRAFRDRKEKHVKNLEDQLQDLHQRYDHLLHNYAEQTEEIAKLKAKFSNAGPENELLGVLGRTPLDSPQPMDDSFYSNPVSRNNSSSFIPQPQLLTPRSYLDFGNPVTTSSMPNEQIMTQPLLPPTGVSSWDEAVPFNSQFSFIGSSENSRYDNVSNSSIARHSQAERSSPDFSREYVPSPKGSLLRNRR